MASRRYKMTPFARLFLFLLFVAPAAYLGISYYNGDNPLAGLQKWYSETIGQATNTQNSETTTNIEEPPAPRPANTKNTSSNRELEEKLRYKEEKNKELKEEVEELEEKIWQLEQEILRLKGNSN